MIVVVDYGMGNLRSVAKALEHLGGSIRVSSQPKDIENATKVVLPGVGAFGDAARELQYRNLYEPLKAYLMSRKPFLGICLGLQLLFSTSDEDKEAYGLGRFAGTNRRFDSVGVKVPHMGWNQVHFKTQHPLLKDIPDQSYFYFVHSFYAVPKEPDLVLGSCTYGDEAFAAILGQDMIVATQFHPEKSQKSGLILLKNFIEG